MPGQLPCLSVRIAAVLGIDEHLDLHYVGDLAAIEVGGRMRQRGQRLVDVHGGRRLVAESVRGHVCSALDDTGATARCRRRLVAEARGLGGDRQQAAGSRIHSLGVGRLGLRTTDEPVR